MTDWREQMEKNYYQKYYNDVSHTGPKSPGNPNYPEPMNLTVNEKCLELATQAHNGQFREDGKTPYIVHPIAVAEIALKIYTLNFNVVIPATKDSIYQVAILHDVLEDCHGYTMDDFVEIGVPSMATTALWLLNKYNHTSGYAEMIKNIASNPLAAIVKYADLTHNSSDLKPGTRLDKYSLAKLYIRETQPTIKFE